MRSLVVALTVATGGFTLTVALRPEGAEVVWADLWLYNGIMVLGAAITILRSGTAGDRTRPWLLIGAAMLADATAGVIYTLESHGTLPSFDVPLSDVLWLVYYPLAFVGLLLLTRRRLSLRVGYAWLDALVVGLGSFAVGLALLGLVIDEPEPGAAAIGVVLNSLYLVGDLVLLVVILTVVQAFNGRPPGAWWLLMAGFLCVIVADGIYLFQQNDGTYVVGSWVDVLWPVSALLIGLAAWRDTRASIAPVRRRRLSFIGPSIAIIAATALLLVVEPHGALEWVAVIAAAATVVLAVVRLNADVQQSLRLTAQLRRSQVDPLTGLMSRRGLLDVDLRAAPSCALILLDVDGFKDVNDSLGHAAGDELLMVVAERLRHHVRETDVLARLGGDEFAAVLWDSDAVTGRASAEALLRKLEEPLSIAGVPLLVTACAGVTDSVRGYPTIGTLLAQADTALKTAQADGRGLVRDYQGAAGDMSDRRLRVRAEARSALDAGGAAFLVYYQPIIGIADGRLLCAEALVRWNHEGRIIPPGEFVAEIARSGDMPALTRHVLRTALHEIDDHHVHLPVCVNVPPELLTPWLLAEVDAALADGGVPAERLIVEITEDAIMKDPSAAAGILRGLRERGVRVLMDDFGTGWSGLSSLRDLIVDGIKVDHSFVSRMTTDPTAAAIVRGISHVASDLGLLVIYEGAEDEDVMAALAEYATGYVQGFVRARPMPVTDLQRWTVSHRLAPMSTPLPG